MDFQMAKSVKFNPNFEVIDTNQFRESFNLELQAEADDVLSTASSNDSIDEADDVLSTASSNDLIDVPKVDEECISHYEDFRFVWPLEELFPYLDAIVAESERAGGQVAKNFKLSDKFKCGFILNRPAEWFIKLKLVEKNNEKYISFGVYLEQILWNEEDLVNPNVDVQCSIKLSQMIGKRYRCVESQHSDFLTIGSDHPYSRKFKFPCFILYETVLQNKIKWETLPSTARFEITLGMLVTERKMEAISKSQLSGKTHEDLNKHCGDLWRAKPADVKILVEGKTFLSHKKLLEDRSAIFEKLLKRANENAPKINDDHDLITLELEDICLEVMGSLLEYIYYERIKPGLEFEKLKELYQIGHIYKICFLKKDILASLDKFCNTKNVGDVLKFAEGEDAPGDVRIRIFEFIKQNMDEFCQ